MTATKIQPVAEICSASHDDAEFGERAIKPLRDISSFEYGTPLYAGAAHAAVAPQGEYPQLPKPAGRIEVVDHPGGINTGGPLTHTADAYTSAQMRAYFDLGRQPEAVAVPAISDEDRMTLAGALGLLRGHRYDGSADALQRVLDADAASPALEAPAAPVDEHAAFQADYLRWCPGKQGRLGRDGAGGYGHAMVQARWLGWSARAALAAAPQALASAPDWWRKRADEIEAQVAATGSSDAMRCYTDMRTLLQSAAAPQAPAAPVVQSQKGGIA